MKSGLQPPPALPPDKEKRMASLFIFSIALVLFIALWLTAFAGLCVFFKEVFDFDLVMWLKRRLAKR